MRLHFRTLPAVVFVLAMTPAMQPQAGELELKKVMLSSAGVGYLEYATEADGPVTLGMDVPLEQIDDVLKSLVVFDSAGGVGGIELPGRDGAAAAFGDVPFGPEALASPVDYLNGLRGVTLEVKGPSPMTGRLMRAERVPEAVHADRSDASTMRTRVTLLATDGLRQFVLEDAEAVQIADPVLRGRIEHALEALRRDAGHSSRHLTLTGSGVGQRTVRVGYVAAAPLWKASYRLVLPPSDKGDDKAGTKARIQGWAVLENTTGVDWNGVQFSLQYGNPVSFRQAIYRSYFVQRPEVPVEILGRLLPDVDTRATEVADNAILGKATMPAALFQTNRSLEGMHPISASERMARPAEAASSSEGAEETIFELSKPVTLASGHSASVPILDRELSARRIGLVELNRPHPVKVTNDTGTSLPGGVLTLYDARAEAAFAGDARLGGLPAGESRLLSFAEDLRTGVAWHVDEGKTIAAVTAAEGVLRVDRRVRRTVQVDLTAPAAEPRDLLVAIPKGEGNRFVPQPGLKPAEETATAWRFAVSLAAGERRSLTVQTDRIVQQAIALPMGDTVRAELLDEQGINDRTWQALQRLTDLRANEVARGAERDRLKAQRNDSELNEERIRKNLGAVPSNDAMHGKLVRQLEAEDARIADLASSIEQADADVVKAKEALAAAVSSFRL